MLSYATGIGKYFVMLGKYGGKNKINLKLFARLTQDTVS